MVLQSQSQEGRTKSRRMLMLHT